MHVATTRILIVFAAALLSALPPVLGAADSSNKPARPNIVFFLIDDLGFADCGFNGGKDILTPNIDRLAKAGTIIDSHYVQPVCSPTRAALMTGRYATHTGVYTIVTPHAKWGLPLSERTLADALKEAGYSTAVVGKWHLGEYRPEYLPMARGFAHHYGHYFGALDYFTHMRGKDLDWYNDGQQLQEKGYTTHLVCDEACRIIERQSQGKPLFLYAAFNGIHSPLEVPDSYLKPYGQLPGSRQKLAGMLAAVDEAIGQIVGTLEKTGQRENTLIIFSADNGGPPPGNNAPLRGFKGSIWEGGVRAAAFANWPDHIPSDVRINEPMHIIDWYPTLAKLAGASLEQRTTLDGLDVWPMLTQGKPSPHDAILCVQSPASAALRIGDWKLLLNAGGSKDNEAGKNGSQPKTKDKKGGQRMPAVMLYNLAADPGETIDLATSEPDRVTTMRAKLDAMLKDAVAPGGKTANE